MYIYLALEANGHHWANTVSRHNCIVGQPICTKVPASGSSGMYREDASDATAMSGLGCNYMKRVAQAKIGLLVLHMFKRLQTNRQVGNDNFLTLSEMCHA